MAVRHKIFKSSFKRWEAICDEAAQFASELPANDLINVSHSCDYTEATVIVWYHGK